MARSCSVASATVVGIGEVSSGRFPDRRKIDAAATVPRAAILDAGLVAWSEGVWDNVFGKGYLGKRG